MTDRNRLGRLDLRILDEPGDRERAERLIQAALARADFGMAPLPWLASRFRPILAAAAAVLLVALGLLQLAPPEGDPAGPAESLAGWVATDHVPTNGEVFAAFRGYQP